LINIFYILGFVFFIDFFIAIYKANKKTNKQLEYHFSRYNMYNIEAGDYNFNYSKENIKCQFNISKDGYLCDIKKADTIFMGGSAAFGVGSRGNNFNICGFLKNDFSHDIINLGIPGWNIEQSVITLLKHIDKVEPKRIIIFDGANNLAFGLSFDYNNLPIDSSPYSFYREFEYKKNYDESKNESIFFTFKKLLRLVLRNSIIVKNIFYLIKPKIKINPKININTQNIVNSIDVAIKNYVKWLKILKTICFDYDIELIVATQPYYMFGRDKNAISKKDLEHIDSVNNFFDNYMLNAYEKLDIELKKINGIKYLPIFKLYKNLGLNLYTDAVHLKTEGYKIIAQYIHNQVGEINVKKNN
jgi:hypothetical protein